MMTRILRYTTQLVILMLTAAICGYILFNFAIKYSWPKLPTLEVIQDYQPNIPLRIYSAEGQLIAEFGEQKRKVTHYSDTPQVLINAILAAEDNDFFNHGGVDYQGLVRSAINNARGGSQQGASTITMQVARNFFLSSERNYIRKFFEIALSYKIENALDKKAILELYMNQIFLGHRSYGFASAAKTYFSKELDQLTLAEAAILAALPKTPSQVNPLTNPEKTKVRQEYVLRRMLELKMISREEFLAALAEPITVRRGFDPEHLNVRSEYVSELARQLVRNIFPNSDIHSMGLNVYTAIKNDNQNAAYSAVRKGIIEYERRYGYRGPEGHIDLPLGIETQGKSFDTLLKSVLSQAKHLDSGGVLTAVVLEASPKSVTVARSSKDIYTISSPAALKHAARGLSANAPAHLRITRGSIVRILTHTDGYELFQLPQVQSALVALDPQTGYINALVGGFDFKNGSYNRVVQAQRQPGSGFKPFIYAAGLSKGVTASTAISDGPFILTAEQTGSRRWEPKNSDGKFGPPLSMRSGLIASRNMVTIRILDFITPAYAQKYIANFGFNPNHHPAFLTMGLGAGSVTPLEMAHGYSVFANGGYKVDPILITKITDAAGETLYEAVPRTVGDPANEAIDPGIAYIMDSILKDVVNRGTARRALALKRNDLAGKTGTTNKAVDTWFNGYNGSQVASVWMGYDQPKPLGSREFGASSTLPIWIDYMTVALKDVPPTVRTRPSNVVSYNNEIYLKEFTPDKGVSNIGHDPMSSLLNDILKSNTIEDADGTTPNSFPPATEPVFTVPVAP